jgi:hypothetical protein
MAITNTGSLRHEPKISVTSPQPVMILLHCSFPCLAQRSISYDPWGQDAPEPKSFVNVERKRTREVARFHQEEINAEYQPHQSSGSP